MNPEKKSVGSVRSAQDKSTNVVLTLEEEIRQRAYQFYEERGRLDGFAEIDWLRAEEEIRNKFYAKSAAA